MTAELATLAADPAAALERAADPAEFVVLACERAKEWLRQAVEHGDIDRLIEAKSVAEATRVYTAQKQIGKDAELAAAEVVRRAERGLVLVVRRGQEAGAIRSRRDGLVPGARRLSAKPEYKGSSKPAPSEYFASKSEMERAYATTNGVSDEQFEEVLAQAKAEENLSGNNVLRKARAKREAQEVHDAAMNCADDETQATDPETGWIPSPEDRTSLATVRRRELIRELAQRGYTSNQIGERLGTRTIRKIARQAGISIPADDALGANTRKNVDSNRIVRETVGELEGLLPGLDLIRLDELDRGEISDWTVSLSNSIRVLNRLNKQLKEMIQ